MLHKTREKKGEYAYYSLKKLSRTIFSESQNVTARKVVISTRTNLIKISPHFPQF